MPLLELSCSTGFTPSPPQLAPSQSHAGWRSPVALPTTILPTCTVGAGELLRAPRARGDEELSAARPGDFARVGPRAVPRYLVIRSHPTLKHIQEFIVAPHSCHLVVASCSHSCHLVVPPHSHPRHPAAPSQSHSGHLVTQLLHRIHTLAAQLSTLSAATAFAPTLPPPSCFTVFTLLSLCCFTLVT